MTSLLPSFTHLTHSREALLAAVLRVSLPLGWVLTVLGTAMSIYEGNLPMIVTNLIGLGLLHAIHRVHRLPFAVKAGTYLAILTGVGVSFLVNNIGAFGLIWLSCVPIAAALLMGRKAAVWVLVAISVGVFSLGYLLKWPLHPVSMNAHPAVLWFLLGLNYFSLNLMLALVTATLLRKMEESAREAEHARDAQRKLAEMDHLTGLPNRLALGDHLRRLLIAQDETGGALLFIDVDHFKDVNDNYGHLEGDHLLVQMATRLSQLIAAPSMVARMGGDEFVVLFLAPAHSTVPLHTQVAALAGLLRQAMLAPFTLGDGVLHQTSISIGVSLIGPGEQTPEDVMREADTAMYQAKARGRNQVVFFEPAMRDALHERMLLEHDLALALRNRQLQVAVQSQVDAQGALIGAELLARWHHPQRGAVSPAQFIRLAEQSELIIELGDWMLGEACLLSRQLAVAGVACPLSVNISARQFRQPDFGQRLLHRLSAHGVNPGAIVLEVTESLLVTEQQDTIATMNMLAQAGLRFSMDDFGTGYSSLSYLKRLPLHELKIDRSFVDDLPHDANDVAIVTMILSMAATLGLRVIAEGVETDGQATFLREHGCNGMQGYLYARPVPAAQWLADLVGAFAHRHTTDGAT